MEINSKKIDLKAENIIIAASTKWPPGVIGLVASRFVGTYGKPTILLHLTKDGIAKGSCRSIAEFNMFDALTARDILVQFGGHSMAAGFSLKVENIPELKKRLERLIAVQLKPEDLRPRLFLDAHIILRCFKKISC